MLATKYTNFLLLKSLDLEGLLLYLFFLWVRYLIFHQLWLSMEQNELVSSIAPCTS